MRSRAVSRWWVMALALWATVPAVRWCPPGWERVCLEALVRCSAASADVACDGAGTACPMASACAERDAHSACAAIPGCPFASAFMPEPGAPRATFPFHRAYCLGDPNGGTGLFAHAPQLRAAPAVHALLPTAPAPERTVALARLVPAFESRPPPRPWLRRPPARAPPSCDLA